MRRVLIRVRLALNSSCHDGVARAAHRAFPYGYRVARTRDRHWRLRMTDEFAALMTALGDLIGEQL